MITLQLLSKQTHDVRLRHRQSCMSDHRSPALSNFSHKHKHSNYSDTTKLRKLGFYIHQATKEQKLLGTTAVEYGALSCTYAPELVR